MIAGRGFHLTYCSNIHRGHTWADVDGALRASLPAIRAQLGAEGPFAIGLRLSADAARELADPEHLEASFARSLRTAITTCPRSTASPTAHFTAPASRNTSIAPTGASRRGWPISNQLADILAALIAGTELAGSVSTVPGAFRSAVTTEDDVRAIAANVLVMPRTWWRCASAPA